MYEPNYKYWNSNKFPIPEKLHLGSCNMLIITIIINILGNAFCKAVATKFWLESADFFTSRNPVEFPWWYAEYPAFSPKWMQEQKYFVFHLRFLPQVHHLHLHFIYSREKNGQTQITVILVSTLTKANHSIVFHIFFYERWTICARAFSLVIQSV